MLETDLVVHAGGHSRRNCPQVFDLPGASPKTGQAAELTTEAGGRLPAQILPQVPGPGGAAGPMRVAFVLPELAAGERLALRAKLGCDRATVVDRIAVRDDGSGTVTVTVDGELLTAYRYLGNPARPCFFPVIGPGGKRVTRSWPIAADVPGEQQDHPHHRSLWVAHGKMNGTDNWSEGPGHGYQLHRGIVATSGGPVLGSMTACNDWTDHDRKKIAEERRTLTAYAVSGNARIFDLEVCFTATECDVRFGDTKEGGILAMRVASSMAGESGGRIENSYGGAGEAECWGRRAQWCDYSGEVEGEVLGIAIFDHPNSYGHPTHWHVRDYGMYTANPFGWHDFFSDPAMDGSHLLQRGASLRFRYRAYLHQGTAAEADVAARYHDYANPPRVEVMR